MSEELSGPEALYPRSIHRAEVLLIPVFWFSLLLLAVFWKLISRDWERVKNRIESVDDFVVESSRSELDPWAFIFFFGHLGSFIYRVERLQDLRDAVGLNDKELLKQKYDEIGLSQPTYLQVWAWLLMLPLVLVIVIPENVPNTPLLGYPILGNIVLGPTLVLHDLRQLRAAGIKWGLTRWIFVIVSSLFFLFPLYILHRKEHVQYRFIYDRITEENGSKQNEGEDPKGDSD